jgi:hypothetical protein
MPATFDGRGASRHSGDGAVDLYMRAVEAGVVLPQLLYVLAIPF